MNVLYTIAFWVIIVGVCALFAWDWIQRNVNAPQNEDNLWNYIEGCLGI